MAHLALVARHPGALFQAVVTDKLGPVNVRNTGNDDAQAIRRHEGKRIVAATASDNDGACGPQNDAWRAGHACSLAHMVGN